MKLLTTVSNSTLLLLLLSVLLTSTIVTAADNRYCYSIIGSPLNEKLKHTTNMTQLGLNIANSYNPGINYQDYQSIYAYKAEYPRLYPLLNCHLKVTPNNSRPGWVHDFSDTLNVGLKKLTKYEFETFRGTGLDNIPKLGDLLQNSGFLSTSKSAQVASAFASSRFLFRFSKSGGRDITGVQGLPFQGELEVIIPPGKCFRVVAFGNQSKWWSDMGPVIVNEYNVNITFIDLMKVKCPKDGKNYFEDTNNDVLSMPTSWELAQFEKSVSRSRFSYESRAIPSEWRCASTSYNTSDGCDCNCGAYDPDCNIPGSSLFGCPSSGAYFCSATNGTCTRVISKYGPVPEQWKCLPNYYGDGVCNCECGYPDPDCQNQNLNSFAYGCLVNQYCNTNGKCQDKKYVPPQWTCSPQYYGSGDGCDCGCGSVLDPDCLDPNQEILNCPCTNMNCTLGYCTGECMGINLLASTTVAPTPGGNDDNKGGEGKVVLVYEGVGVFVASIIASFFGGSFITMFVMIGLYFLITHVKKRKANKLGTNPDLNHQFIQMHNNQ